LATRLIVRWFLQMSLNTVLMTGIFIAAVYVDQHPPAWLDGLAFSKESLKTVLWLAAVFCSLPLFIATSRKLQALGLLIAELRVTRAAAGERTAAIQSVVSQVIPIAGTAILGFYVLVLTSTLLPSFKVLIGLLFLVGLLAWLLRRSFIKVYSKAQAALHETLSQPPPVDPHNKPALPALLREANLKTIAISPTSAAAGKLIHELQLRTQTGASIVGIERNGASIINPGADESLLAGDQILLLGSQKQLEAAKIALG
jgi:CPA2 family monovalent cation:H+ antiporter-2